VFRGIAAAVDDAGYEALTTDPTCTPFARARARAGFDLVDLLRHWLRSPDENRARRCRRDARWGRVITGSYRQGNGWRAGSPSHPARPAGLAGSARARTANWRGQASANRKKQSGAWRRPPPGLLRPAADPLSRVGRPFIMAGAR